MIHSFTIRKKTHLNPIFFKFLNAKSKMSAQDSRKIIDWMLERFDFAKRANKYPPKGEQTRKAIQHCCELLFANSINPEGSIIAVNFDVMALEQEIFKPSTKGLFAKPVKDAIEFLQTERIEGKKLVEVVAVDDSGTKLKFTAQLIKHAIQSLEQSKANLILAIEKKFLAELNKVASLRSKERLVNFDSVQRAAAKFVVVGIRSIIMSTFGERYARAGHVETAKCIPGQDTYDKCGEIIAEYKVNFNIDQMKLNFLDAEVGELAQNPREGYIEKAFFILCHMEVPELNGPAYESDGAHTLAITENALKYAMGLKK